MRKQRAVTAAAGWLLLSVILVNALGFVLLRINDPDFFWHLRTGERPQFISFVCAAVLLLLLCGLKEPGNQAAARWRAAAVAPLMVLWANAHGGFIVGLGLLGTFALALSLKLLNRRLEPLPAERLRLVLAATAGGFLASLVNPNGWQVFRIAFLPVDLTQNVQE